MSIFKRKSTKAKQEAEIKQKEQAAADAAPKQAYKHVPKHAGADSATGNSSTTVSDRQRISLANQRRMSSGRDSLPTPNSHYAYSMHGVPPPVPSIRNLQRNSSPGGPVSPMERLRSNGSVRSNSDYFARSQNAPSFDSPMLGNPKMQIAARDRGYINPHYSADSGYGSAGPASVVHSRAPSELHYSDSNSTQPEVPRSNNGFLPELTLGDDLARDPALSEHSFGAAEDEYIPTKSALKNGNRTQYSHSAQQKSTDFDARSIASARSMKSNRSVSKQTRFEQPQEAIPAMPSHYAQQQQMLRPVQAMSPPPQVQEQYQQVEPAQQQAYSESSEEAEQQQVERSQPLRRAHYSTSPNAYAPVERITSPNSSALPPLSILEGFKVNKKGKLLDEEGEPVGELYEGELIDCIRLKADAYGLVRDEYGSVVGRVRTLSRQDGLPVLSPTLGPVQPNGYEQSKSPATVTESRESIISQETATAERRVSLPLSSIHSPSASQDQLTQIVSRESGTLPYIHAPRAVRPLDLGSDMNHIELDASEHSQAAPLLDHSDIFVPEFRRHTPSKASPPPQAESPATVKEEPRQQPTPSASPAPRSPRPQFSRENSSEEKPVQRFPARNESLRTRTPVQETQVMQPPQVIAPSPEQKSRRMPLLRSSSETSMGESSVRSYSRPSMDPVPENSNMPAEEFNPALLKYRGEIPPAPSGPPPQMAIPSPPMMAMPSPPMSARAFGKSPVPPMPQMNSAMLSPKHIPMNSAQFSSAGGAGVPKRAQFATGMPGVRPGMGSGKSSFINTPIRRSPLSSHETSPPESEESTSDDGKATSSYTYQPMQRPSYHGRSQSVRTTASARTTTSIATNGKPRTYFTHSGRIPASEVPPPAPGTAAAEAKDVKKDTASVMEKKKSRFSFGRFGSKKQSVSAK